MSNNTISLKCPQCSTILRQQTQSNTAFYRCENQHTFDIAKEGYINLLLAHNKRSKLPGDSKEMMQCRRVFLEAGYYDFLIKSIAQCIQNYIQVSSKTYDSASPSLLTNLLDIGCAEGYYATQLQQHISTNMYGLDIAKEGVRMAAKRKIFNANVVASAYDLPYFDQQFDIALSVFSPLSLDECIRILKPGGYLIAVGPGPSHLKGLAEKIYSQFKPHQNPITQWTHSALQKVEHIAIKENLTIKGEHTYPLLTMTPYYWSCRSEQQKAIEQLDQLQTPIEFEITLFQKKSENTLSEK